MKKIIICFLAVSAIISCGNPKKEEKKETPKETANIVTEEVSIQYTYFGDTISKEGAITIEEFIAKMVGKDSVRAKIRAEVNEVCQKKGCWMTVKLTDSTDMTIRFKDYGFFVPKDCSGKMAIFEGWAYTDTISVEELRHYAEDGGAAPEEIEKITEPEITLAFEAEGVILEEPKK
ncbi:MAG: DUF4920 domain-containing protein [Bacteroidetes bacterium]|nr:MAG: DUF4920 domain-containing protein [Bacteroidota bacterium]